MKVKNQYGKEIDYDIAVAYMDRDLTERIHNKDLCKTEQEFFDTYCLMHEVKNGEEFIANMVNPVW